MTIIYIIYIYIYICVNNAMLEATLVMNKGGNYCPPIDVTVLISTEVSTELLHPVPGNNVFKQIG